MKTNHLFIFAFLVIFQVGFAQNDTIRGMLLDVDYKVIKNYPITLGRVSPVRVKTDKNGIFIFPNANLQDTLFVADKKGRNAVAIPINGFPFVAIMSINGEFISQYFSDPDDQLVRSLQKKENAKKRNPNMLTREDIEKSGCRDVSCLLRQFSGVTINDGIVIIKRAAASVRSGLSTGAPQSPGGALFVLDGFVSDGLLTVMNSVKIDNIETISVLKDASSMYGDRGSNGAIVINTRRK